MLDTLSLMDDAARWPKLRALLTLAAPPVRPSFVAGEGFKLFLLSTLRTSLLLDHWLFSSGILIVWDSGYVPTGQDGHAKKASSKYHQTKDR